MASETKNSVAQRFIARREKNLRFFRESYPSIFEKVSSLKMQRVQVQVSGDGKDTDLTIDGGAIYGGKAKGYSVREAEALSGEYPAGCRLSTVKPIFVKTNEKEKDLAATILRRVVGASKITPDGFEGYVLEDFLPAVVFFGVGLGYHIEHLITQRRLIDAVVFEPDPEVFAASLFTVDWEAVHGHFAGKGGRSLRFAVGSAGDGDTSLYRQLEGEVVRSEPLFPVGTVFYNHRARESMAQLGGRINQGISARFSSWGNYDDELCRLNNLFHNVRGRLWLLAPEARKQQDVPVVIVGSGPSIDGRIEALEKYRDRVLLVSAGTGIRGLHQRGMVPDFHVELDPKYVIYQHLAELDPDYLARITLLAVVDINPHVPRLFKKTYFYVKDTNPHAHLLGLHKDRFPFCHPTCTNAATALFCVAGFRTIFLFGCDFGFRPSEGHHSRYSIYGEDADSRTSQQLKKQAGSLFSNDHTFEVEGVDGSPVRTRSDFYSAKRRMEYQIEHWKQQNDLKIEILNCSDGARIEGAPWVALQDFIERVAPLGTVGSDTVGQALKRSKIRLKPSEIQSVKKDLFRFSRQYSRGMIESVSSSTLETKWDMGRVCVGLSEASNPPSLGGTDEKTRAGLLIRHLVMGAIKRLTFAGFSHAMAHENQEDLSEFFREWEESLCEFFEVMPAQLEEVLDRPVEIDDDPWLQQSAV